MRFAGTVDQGREALVALEPAGEEICRAGLELESYSPLLGRDLVDLKLAGPLTRGRGDLYFGHQKSLAPELYVDSAWVSLAAGIDLETAESLGPGRVWFLGSRDYSRVERDYARNQQRLLPHAEVNLEVALQTAAAEIGPRSVFLSVHLDVLSPAFAPGVERLIPLGVSDRELWTALRGFQPARLAGIEVIGLASERDEQGRTAMVAAQLVRDLALLHFESIESKERSEG